jgi:alkylation response protein AidB-like acyl-CoA dehydrogenase
MKWVIDGSKQFITNSGRHHLGLHGDGAYGHSRERQAGDLADHRARRDPRFTVGPSYAKLGWHASDTHLTLPTSGVAEDHLLGERGEVSAKFLSILDDGRCDCGLAGMHSSCLELSDADTHERTTSVRRSDASRVCLSRSLILM